MTTTMPQIQANVDRTRWERDLKVGDEVSARWTNSFMQYEARAKVVRVNRSSIRVELVETIEHAGTVYYPAGRQIALPSMLDWRRWSVNNCVAPVAK